MAARRRDVKKETFWRRTIRLQVGSGLSVRVWCRDQGVNEATFHWWRRELTRRDAEQEALSRRDVEVQAPSFVPVCVTGDDRNGEPRLIEIVLADGRCIRIAGSVDQQMLTDVLDVLECRAC